MGWDGWWKISMCRTDLWCLTDVVSMELEVCIRRPKGDGVDGWEEGGDCSGVQGL